RTVVEEVLHLLLFDVGALHLLAGLERGVEHATGEEVADPGAGERVAFARLDVLELDNLVRLAVDHDLEPIAEVGSLVHRCFLASVRERPGRARRIYAGASSIWPLRGLARL